MLPVIQVGGLVLPSYGLLVASGYLLGIGWLYRRLGEMRGTPGEFWALVYALFFGALAGGRLGYLLMDAGLLAAAPRAGAGGGGWVFWTGLLGTFVMGGVFQQVYNRVRRPRRYLPVADYFVTALALGHSVGRLGCFLNACCHGRPTGLPWGVSFTHPACALPDELMGALLHPVQLYEAAGSLALFLLLSRRVLPRVRDGRWRHGTAFFLYIAAYSAMRFGLEFLRGDDRGAFLSPALSPSQWISAAAFLIAAAVLRRRGLREPDPKGRSVYLEHRGKPPKSNLSKLD